MIRCERGLTRVNTQCSETIPRLGSYNVTFIIAPQILVPAFPHGAPRSVFSDNGKQLTAKFFQHVCETVGMKNLSTTAYHPQGNGQCERFNRTILTSLRHYVADHTTNWDLFAKTVAFAHNSQVHSSTGVAPFELVVFRGTPGLTLSSPSEGDPVRVKNVRERSATRFEVLVPEALNNLAKAQERYRRTFERRCRPLRDIPVPGGWVYFGREQTPAEDAPQHKLARVADGPFTVKEVTPDTVVLY